MAMTMVMTVQQKTAARPALRLPLVRSFRSMLIGMQMTTYRSQRTSVSISNFLLLTHHVRRNVQDTAGYHVAEFEVVRLDGVTVLQLVMPWAIPEAAVINSSHTGHPGHHREYENRPPEPQQLAEVEVDASEKEEERELDAPQS